MCAVEAAVVNNGMQCDETLQDSQEERSTSMEGRRVDLQQTETGIVYRRGNEVSLHWGKCQGRSCPTNDMCEVIGHDANKAVATVKLAEHHRRGFCQGSIFASRRNPTWSNLRITLINLFMGHAWPCRFGDDPG